MIITEAIFIQYEHKTCYEKKVSNSQFQEGQVGVAVE
jgi:hypothetical protein